MESIRLTEAVAADEPALRDLLLRAFPAEGSDAGPLPDYSWLGGRIAMGRVFLSGTAAKPEGVLVFGGEDSPHSMRIEKVAVDPRRQGMGIGRSMVRDAITIARHRGMSQLKLMTASKFDRLHTFYIEMGFKLVGYGADPDGRDRTERAFFVRDIDADDNGFG